MSGCNEDYVELARKAQLGDTESLNRLAEAARVRLHEYVFRLTLQEDLTQDIVQETILEMLRIFERLRRRERFWPWLYGIAFNKVRNHYGKRWRQRTRSFSEVGYEPRVAGGGDALAEAVTAELKQVVLQCIGELEPRHRAVLSMRCYDQMSYAEIAKLMNRSEIAVRALFCRAKKALARRLSAHGLGKHSLLLALVVFGKVTATTEAAAAQVSVTTATLTVGPLAALAALLTDKAAVITVLSAAALIAGSVTVGHYRVPGSVAASRPGGSAVLPAAPWVSESATAEQECWHYFPQGPDGAVMTRLLEYESPGTPPCCRILENQYANYHYDQRHGVVRIDNHRAWKPDLSVKRLPTDSAAVSEFIAQVEGRPSNMEQAASGRSGLLVVCKRQGRGESRIWRVERRMNALAEEYFHHSWPESTKIIDCRDPMHKRGWTVFRIEGEMNGAAVCGSGRLPFVYAARARHAPGSRCASARTYGSSTHRRVRMSPRATTSSPYATRAGAFSRDWGGPGSACTASTQSGGTLPSSSCCSRRHTTCTPAVRPSRCTPRPSIWSTPWIWKPTSSRRSSSCAERRREPGASASCASITSRTSDRSRIRLPPRRGAFPQAPSTPSPACSG